jgi:hypothetical protein
METATKDKPIISPQHTSNSATVAGMTIKHFEGPETPELTIANFRSLEDQKTEYSFVSYVEPLAILRKYLQKIEGIKRVCLTHEELVIHVWIMIEKEDWDIRERIYNAEHDIYLAETFAFHFDFHVSEECKISDCLPLFGS